MLHKVTALLIIILFLGFVSTQAQDYSKLVKPNVFVTGSETPDMSNIQIVETSGTITFDSFVSTNGLVWDVHSITDVTSGYDLQSNGSTEQLWVSSTNPDYLHAVFTQSSSLSPWSDRTSLYFGSTDKGVTWFALGGVPVNTGSGGRSGFPAIFGLSDGRAVIANHPEYGSPVRPRTTLYIDNTEFEYNFTGYEPSPLVGDANQWPIWPRLIADQNDNIVLASSQSANYGTADSAYTNTFNTTSNTYSGWQVYAGDQAETYAFAVSDGGKIGMAFLGAATIPGDNANVYYWESTDGGLTWGPRTTVFQKAAGDTVMGAIRGVTVNFYGEEPCVSYEICLQILSGGNFFPGLPSEIHFWSPNINGGNPKVVADSNNVPYWPYLGTNDVQVPVCRPVLSRSEIYDVLVLAFDATTENYQPSSDTTSYCAGYFMYSTDGGDTWTAPEKYTPVGLPGLPIIDWRYPSMPSVLPVELSTDVLLNVHIAMQGDTIAGSTVNAAGQPVGVTAQFYHFYTEINLGPNSVGDPTIVNDFNLEQNYPNPFNPSTSINYTLAERSAVTLKVYDVLGNEVATLVNNTMDAGKHSVKFDASKFASGLYIYTLNAGNFTSSKKMMLLK